MFLQNFIKFAELYKDYEPSEQFIQLTVVAVEPNYLDNYIVNLKKTWVRAMEIQKEHCFNGIWFTKSDFIIIFTFDSIVEDKYIEPIESFRYEYRSNDNFSN